MFEFHLLLKMYSIDYTAKVGCPIPFDITIIICLCCFNLFIDACWDFYHPPSA